MKSLKFRRELAELVLNGTKYSTWRLFDDKALEVGDELELVVWETLDPFANATITKVVEKPLGRLTPEDKLGHEDFISDQQMYDTYSKYYKRQVTPDTLIKIIYFKLI